MTDQTPTDKRPNVLLLALIGVAVIAIASIAVAVFVGTTGAATAARLEGDLASQTDRAEHLSGQLDSYKKRETDLMTREGAVETLEAELAEREAAVSATEAQIAATTLKDGYTYTVGQSMEPGVYQANAVSGSCYWAIYVSGTNYSDIVDNDLGTNGQLTVTVSPGQDFKSTRCGDWQKVG